MITITHEEIKNKLLNHYSETEPTTREFVITSTGYKGGEMMYLSGSPPKGYAIYIKVNAFLSLYDNHGKRWKMITNVEVIA